MPEHTPSAAKDPRARAILESHERMRAALKQMRSGTSFVDVCAEADRLRGILSQHFRLEEEDEGLFASILARAPRYHARVAELRSEHTELRAALQALCERACRCSPREQAAMREEIAAFAARVEDHESRETEVFVKSWCTELGELD